MEEELARYEKNEEKASFNLEELVIHNKLSVLALLIGIILTGLGVFLYKDGYFTPATKIEVLETTVESEKISGEVVVEVSGAVKNPGVYKLPVESRVEDAIVAAGGLTQNLDISSFERVINRAAKVTDGQKIFIPIQQLETQSAKNSSGEYGVNNAENANNTLGVTSESNPVNINTASAKTLESLWGIGPVTAQNIIEQRPYSTVEELLTKKVLKSNVYERNKSFLTVY